MVPIILRTCLRTWIGGRTRPGPPADLAGLRRGRQRDEVVLLVAWLRFAGPDQSTGHMPVLLFVKAPVQQHRSAVDVGPQLVRPALQPPERRRETGGRQRHR